MSDEEILNLYHAGEQERAFSELVGSYSERLYWHVRGLTGSHEDTDDLLQDIFLKVWNALLSFRGDARLYTWLFRIATNETLNFLRKRKLLSALGLSRTRTLTSMGMRPSASFLSQWTSFPRASARYSTCGISRRCPTSRCPGSWAPRSAPSRRLITSLMRKSGTIF